MLKGDLDGNYNYILQIQHREKNKTPKWFIKRKSEKSLKAPKHKNPITNSMDE